MFPLKVLHRSKTRGLGLVFSFPNLSSLPFPYDWSVEKSLDVRVDCSPSTTTKEYASELNEGVSSLRKPAGGTECGLCGCHWTYILSTLNPSHSGQGSWSPRSTVVRRTPYLPQWFFCLVVINPRQISWRTSLSPWVVVLRGLRMYDSFLRVLW